MIKYENHHAPTCDQWPTGNAIFRNVFFSFSLFFIIPRRSPVGELGGYSDAQFRRYACLYVCVYVYMCMCVCMYVCIYYYHHHHHFICSKAVQYVCVYVTTFQRCGGIRAVQALLLLIILAQSGKSYGSRSRPPQNIIQCFVFQGLPIR